MLSAKIADEQLEKPRAIGSAVHGCFNALQIDRYHHRRHKVYRKANDKS